MTLVTAWFSNLFYYPDEHFQALEFLGLKLGITPPSAMPPEYRHVRSWTLLTTLDEIEGLRGTARTVTP